MHSSPATRRGSSGILPAEVPLVARRAEDVQGHWPLARLGKRVLRPGRLRLNTVAERESLLTAVGLRVRMIRASALALLEPQRIPADEGFVGAMRFARNLARDKPARRRVRTMARTMRAHKVVLQAAGIVAVKSSGPNA